MCHPHASTPFPECIVTLLQTILYITFFPRIVLLHQYASQSLSAGPVALPDHNRLFVFSAWTD